MSKSTELKFFIVLLYIIIGPGLVLPNTPEAYFTKGNELYQKGDFKGAIREYNKVLDSGYESWQVYYNLGNAFFRERQIAKAILNFERAKRLNPNEDDIEYNLELANLAAVDRIQEIPPFFLNRWIMNLVHWLSLNFLGALTIGLYLVLIATIILRMFTSSVKMRKIVFISMISIAVFFSCFAGLLSIKIIDKETKVEAIVVQDRIVVKSAPVDTGTEVFTLHAGVKVEIQDRSQAWLRIKLADGKRGWLKTDAVEVI